MSFRLGEIEFFRYWFLWATSLTHSPGLAMQHLRQRGIVPGHIRRIVHNHMRVLVADQVLLQIHIAIVWHGLPGGYGARCAGSSCSARGSCSRILATGRPATLAGRRLRGGLLGARGVAAIKAKVTESNCVKSSRIKNGRVKNVP